MRRAYSVSAAARELGWPRRVADKLLRRLRRETGRRYVGSEEVMKWKQQQEIKI